MKKFLVVLGLGCLIAEPAFALRLVQAPSSNSIIVNTGSADCRGPIATANRPLRATSSDPNRLMRMKQAGKLPDQFVCGQCTYSLGGDPSVAYYVKSCR